MRVPLRPRDLCALAVVSVFALAASGTHVVGSGETLGAIAKQHGVTVAELVEANGISNPNLIMVGQELTIPGAAPTPVTHVVAPGDTLAGIAKQYGTTVAAIAAANGITNPNLIVIGSSLTVEGATSGGGGSGTPQADPGSSSGGGGSGVQLPGQRHTVVSGDTIAGIARRYGISASDFIRWNGLVDGKIYATTRLLLYNPGTLPSFGGGGGTASTTHTVKPGETLSSIAAKYGVSASAIASASGISDPNRIVVGQRLTIPGGSGSGGGGFVCPVAGASFFNDWGFPRSGGRSHAGNDVFAPRGTPVRAPVAGHVDQATGSIGGHQFRLTSADGTQWFGSHMDAFGKRGSVAAGDVIGYVGDSGNARGGRPHLHFEVHPGGNAAVNPYPLLRSSC